MLNNHQTIKKDVSDHLRTIAVAAVNVVPFAGGPVAALLSEYLPNSLESRKTSLLLQLDNDLKNLADRFDQKSLKKEEFLSIFMQAFRQIMVTHQQEKINAFRAIILNTVINNSAKADESLLFLNLTERLTPLHLKLLKIFSDPVSALRNNQQANSRIQSLSMGGLGELTRALLPEYPNDIVVIAFKDLYNMGMHNTPEFMTTMTAHGITQSRVNDFGRKYLEFITLPNQLS